MKFPITFNKKRKKGHIPYFFMEKERMTNDPVVPDLTDAEEVRKAIFTSEILNRKY